MLLQQYFEDAKRAFDGISFDPEKRAGQLISDYSGELLSDLAELGDNQGNYKEKYISKLIDWLHAKAKCISPMITGPSNFLVSRNRKANSSEQKRYEEFRSWRERYIKAVNRVPTKSPEEEIDDALKLLDAAIERQEVMKRINKIAKSVKYENEEKYQKIMELDLISEKEVKEIIFTKEWWGQGYPGFILSNNNAKINRLKGKLTVMRNRIACRDNFEPIKFDGGEIVIKDDRVCICYDEKPEREVIEKLKSNGFRWSPKNKRWQRKHTKNAMYTAKRIMGIV